MAVKKGLYEKVINKTLSSSLAEEKAELMIEKEKIDKVQGRKVFASYLATVIEQGLKYLESDPEAVESQIGLVNRMIKRLASDVQDEELQEFLVQEDQLLRAIHETEKKYKVPLTSVAYTSLFTGAKSEPRIYSELIKEISSADRIDFLISFIRFSGLRLI